MQPVCKMARPAVAVLLVPVDAGFSGAFSWWVSGCLGQTPLHNRSWQGRKGVWLPAVALQEGLWQVPGGMSGNTTAM